MGWKSKVTDARVLEDLHNGLTLLDIQAKYHLCSCWAYQARAKRLASRAKRVIREERRESLWPITSYILPQEEIVRRYGRCGVLAEKKEYTFIPDTSGEGKNRPSGEEKTESGGTL